ncbi:hypothetical protein EMPS_02232 [Entomortierella parvispora]|uniref:Mechanosensitive ion channel MscS domain-containing protein n=1 Tax=Entomortierella parvispora TaxID=205924 RepID=A0A9P3H518_9FUNG|nr:hypothetical protein EMPS_02232 [Entomortierella parvispora]
MEDCKGSSPPLSENESSPVSHLEKDGEHCNRHHKTHHHHHHQQQQKQNQDNAPAPPTQQSNTGVQEREKEYDESHSQVRDHCINEGAVSGLIEHFRCQGSTSVHLGQHPPSAASTPILHEGNSPHGTSGGVSGSSIDTQLENDDVVIKSSVKKPVDTEAPTALRRRRSNRLTQSARNSEESMSCNEASTPLSGEARASLEAPPHGSSAGSGRIVVPVASIQRKPSLSSMRDHVPANIRTTDQQLKFKLSVEEASPPSTSSKQQHASILTEELSGVATGSDIDDRDDDFDWGEDNVEDDTFVDPSSVIQDDISFRIHPFVSKVLKNILILFVLLIPRIILHHVHTHHHETIVLIEDGRPYVAVVIGNHIAYYVIRFLVMGLFKLIHRFGTVAIKITLETHDGLVPYVARSVWLMNLITFWAIFVHYPSCARAKNALELVILEGGAAAAVAETEANAGLGGVELQCRRWVFWWVYRFLWGIQAMLVLYILKRYSMQVLSDRFEQDNSKYVELNFQGHVLDGLQKIKHPLSRASHPGSHYPGGGLKNPAAWLVKSTSGSVAGGVIGPASGARSPALNSARLFSALDRRPSTATIVAEDVSLGHRQSSKRSIWMLLKNSFQKRKKEADSTENNVNGSEEALGGRDEKSAVSPSDSIHETESDHALPEPEELVRMSRKRKSRLVNSLRNKPIDNPNKKAKELWNRICPADQRYLVRADLQPAFKKEIFERVWKLFDPSGGETITPAMFKKAYDVGDRIELNGSYFTITTIHILTTEMKRNDGMQVLSPNYVLGTRHIHNLSRAGDHIDNVYMDIPLFSSARTIQKLKQKIQAFVEGEASADYFKIDVILNAKNNHTKDGTCKAGLQILFRVHHRNRWVDSDFSPRKLKSILFLRAALNELELEDLKDLIEIRRSLGYGIAPAPLQAPNPVLNEGGYPVGFVGTSENVYDSPDSRNQTQQGEQPISEVYPHPEISGSVYLARDNPTMGASPSSVASILSQRSLRSTVGSRESERDPSNETTTLSTTTVQHASSHNLGARHVLVPETIQLSTNAANFQPYPNGFQFQR